VAQQAFGGLSRAAFVRVGVVFAMLCSLTVAFLGAALTQQAAAGASIEIFGNYGGGHEFGVEPSGGYWITGPQGSVTPYAGAPYFGSLTSIGIRPSHPVVGIAATPSGRGYWTVASDGGIFSFGDAQFYGSTGSIRLNQPIVGMTATPTGNGYWMVASDGGIFSYGDAQFYGSTGSIRLNQPIVGMAATPDGRGYWLVASDGGIFSYGDAQFYGSTGALRLNQPIVGMAVTPDGGGYWLVASDGGIFSFGDAGFYGSTGGTGASALGLMVDPSAQGYSIIGTDGSSQAFAPTGAGASSVPAPTVQNAGIGGGAQGSDCQPLVQPTATADPGLTQVFTGQTGPGWLGADSTYSTQLPDGRDSFVFSDTLIGTAQPNGSATFTGMPNNSELVGNLPNLNTDIGGTYGRPQSLIPDGSNGDMWWTGATYVENGVQLIYVSEYQSISGNPFGLSTGQSGIAVMSLPSGGLPRFQSITPLPTDPDTTWGHAVLQTGSYVYVYGIVQDPSSGTYFGMKVARVPQGQSLDTGSWTYWNGSSWLAGEQNASIINPGSILTGIAPQAGGSGYVAVSIPGGSFNGTSVALSYACSPTGPWSQPQAVYTIPQISEFPGEIAYTPTFHPELSQNGLVVSYNINNPNNPGSSLQNVHEYQPQFLLLSN